MERFTNTYYARRIAVGLRGGSKVSEESRHNPSKVMPSDAHEAEMRAPVPT